MLSQRVEPKLVHIGHQDFAQRPSLDDADGLIVIVLGHLPDETLKPSGG